MRHVHQNRTALSIGLGAVLLSAFASTGAFANSDLRLSGFASLVGGTVVDGDGYWARLPEAAGQYESGWDFQTESRVGLQARYQAADKLALTGQVMIRGINDFEPELEWLYASYYVTPDANISVGRMRLPVYHYSDFMDVGIAYPWLRVPSDAYSLAVTNYHGVAFNYNWDWDIGTTSFKLYAGQQDTDPNDLITTIEQYKTEQLYDDSGKFRGVRGVTTTKKYEDMKGIVVDTQVDWFNLRLSFLDGKERFTFFAEGDYPSTPLFGGTWADTRFVDVSMSIDKGGLFAIAEWNEYDTIYESWFTSVAYTIGKWVPYIFYSEFEGTLRFIAPGGITAGFEDGVNGSLDDSYSTVAIGVRYNINPRTAIKAEFLDFSDDGDAAVFIDEDRDGDTDAQAFAVSLDIAF
ncbi:hypothetical protein OE749_12895 [Aestuariibacter sp. AA17]|uniref:Porin domain-containing protein n=1 Tax=Fluctibacter corallii TaxID=2984329 RepID=A0ABT3AAG7_9ALTE|nr:hypothetical protein [Aestuariibacter sp. AA17]MCV2885590.1 hypothetical protein [Aestuariibacter sp. AA17]